MTSKMSPETVNNKMSKFTRGEKCILLHVSVTLFAIIVLVIVYVLHICLVKHSGDQFFSVRRKSTEINVPMDWKRVGAVVLHGSRLLCGSVLVRSRWSLAPAHCIAARADPALAELLPLWTIRYLLPELIETAIYRGVVHSQFNRDDMQNNVGLFEHKDQIMLGDFTISSVPIDNNILHTKTSTVVSLQINTDGTVQHKQVDVSQIAEINCQEMVLPVTELRPYEYCAMLVPDKGLFLDHGAAFMLNSEVKGFFAWGDKHGHFPLIMLDFNHFKDWVENIIY